MYDFLIKIQLFPRYTSDMQFLLILPAIKIWKFDTFSVNETVGKWTLSYCSYEYVMHNFYGR